jgi:chromosome segregation ATPase
MKNPLQVLLMFFAVCLCALCTYQWYGQVLQRKELTALTQTNYDLGAAIHGYTNSMNTMDRQISQMDARISELKDTVATNNAEIFQLKGDNTRLTATVEAYSNAVAALQGQLKQANENIVRQNEAMKNLVTERNEFVTRLNDAVKERNEIVNKFNEVVTQVTECTKERNEIVTRYNELVKRIEEQQAEAAKKQPPSKK